MTRVLLFGATGFLGRHVREAFASTVELVCPGRAECDLVGIEVAPLTALVRTVRPDAVVNCAGMVSGSGHQLVGAHAGVTGKLIEAVAAGAPGARLVRLGSAAEYGPTRYGELVREDHPAVPITEYGVSQLAATRLLELAEDRVDGIVLRVFNPVGPGLHPAHALGRAAALLRQAVEHGDGHIEMGILDTHRDFVDVRDVASAVRAAALAPFLPARVVNVATGQAVPTSQAIELVAEIAGFAGTIRPGALSPAAARSVQVPWICADVSRAAGILGWVAAHDLRDSIRSLWDGAGRAGVGARDQGACR